MIIDVGDECNGPVNTETPYLARLANRTWATNDLRNGRITGKAQPLHVCLFGLNSRNRVQGGRQLIERVAR